MPTTLRNTDILFNDGTTQSTAASQNPTVSAGSNYNFVSTNLIGTAFTTYALVAGRCWTTRVTVSGTIRVRYVLTSEGAQTVYGRIYRNGTAVGTERSTTSQSGVAFTEDIAISAGDLLQISMRSINSIGAAYIDSPGTAAASVVVTNLGFNSNAVT